MVNGLSNPENEVDVVYEEITILRDLDGLTDDFMLKCGYSEQEAQEAAKNVLLEDGY